MHSVSVQDPVLEPTWITEGTLPLWMRFGSFHVAGQAWAKYHYEHPWGSFAEWLSAWNEDMIGITQIPNNFGLSFCVIQSCKQTFFFYNIIDLMGEGLFFINTIL